MLSWILVSGFNFGENFVTSPSKSNLCNVFKASLEIYFGLYTDGGDLKSTMVDNAKIKSPPPPPTHTRSLARIPLWRWGLVANAHDFHPRRTRLAAWRPEPPEFLCRGKSAEAWEHRRTHLEIPSAQTGTLERGFVICYRQRGQRGWYRPCPRWARWLNENRNVARGAQPELLENSAVPHPLSLSKQPCRLWSELITLLPWSQSS